jgi:ribosome maturation factor RimP
LIYREAEIRKSFEDEIQGMGFELVDFKLNISNRESLIILFVDKDGGITVNECGKISRSISDLIFRKALFERNYRLEVSSPGLDRPLITKRDFERNVGRDVVLEYKNEVEVKRIEGKILSADDELILEKGNDIISVSFDKISRGKIKLKW